MVAVMNGSLRRLRFVVPVLAAVAVLSMSAAADGAVVTGRITGTAIPADAAGDAFVRAVNLLTGEVIASDDTDASGRYRLTVPKGAFALFPSVVTLTKVVAPKPTKVRLKRGQRASIRLPARPKAVTLRPIVAMKDNAFTGASGEFSGLNRGLRDMLSGDLVSATGPGCEVAVVERSARFIAAYNTELALVRKGLVDPATAIRAGRIINPTRGIRGTITVSGGRMVIAAEVFRWSSGKTVGRTSVEGAAEEFFELEPLLTRKLVALLCDQPPPVAGTFTGSIDYARQTPVGAFIGSLQWNGSVELEPQTTPGLPPVFGGPSASYTLKSGSIVASITLRSVMPACTITGQGTIDLTTITPGVRLPVLSVTEGTPDTYRLAMDGGLGKIPTIRSECPPGQEASNGTPGGDWPLLQIGLLPFSQTPVLATEGIYSGSATGSTPGLDDGYQWTWNLRG